MSEINDLLNNIANIKLDIKNAIINKGQTVTNFNSYSQAINGINTSSIINVQNAEVEGTALVFNNNPYTELEYIQSTGTQYINTGLSSGSNSMFSYDIKFKINTIEDAKSILGVNKSASSLTIFSNSIKLNNNTVISSINTSTVYELTYNRSTGVIVVNGTTYNISTSITDDSGQIQIFSRSGASDVCAKMELYYCKIYNADRSQLKRDYIPVKRTSDNTLCLYDKVTDTYFYNQGTGTFIAGPEKGGN